MRSTGCLNDDIVVARKPADAALPGAEVDLHGPRTVYSEAVASTMHVRTTRRIALRGVDAADAQTGVFSLVLVMGRCRSPQATRSGSSLAAARHCRHGVGHCSRMQSATILDILFGSASGGILLAAERTASSHPGAACMFVVLSFASLREPWPAGLLSGFPQLPSTRTAITRARSATPLTEHAPSPR
jgi:hypothetical protein